MVAGARWVYTHGREFLAFRGNTVNRRSNGTLDILTYHAVTPGAAPLDDWCFLPARQFAAQMAFLHRFRFNVVPLNEAVDAIAAGRLRRRTVAITFDDGYTNNITTALPILERYGFPATVFLVSGLIGSKKGLWPSRIIAALSASERVEIEVGSRRYALGSRENRVRASRELQAWAKAESGDDPDAAAEVIERACGTAVDPAFDADSDFAMMSASAIRETAEKGLMEFGAHTVTHPILSKLTDGDVEAEIRYSVARVQEVAGHPCRLFAYPNGSLDDFDDRAVTALKATGVEASVTTVQARNLSDSDPFRLSRWDVGSDISLARFAATVSGLRPSNVLRRLGANTNATTP